MKTTYETDSRQKELINKYYEVDEENKLVEISFYYTSASELFTLKEGTKIPRFAKEELEKINEIIKTIPLEYKIDISYEIENYEDYTPSFIMESFNDALELTQFSVRKSSRKNWLVSTIMILIGIILLSFMIIGNSNSLFGEGVKAEIISEIIDISAWVFIWEAVTLLFLEHSDQELFALRIKNRVNSIVLYKKGEENYLAKEMSNELFGKWKDEGKIRKFGKYLLLFSSSALFVISFYAVYEVCLAIASINSENYLTIVIGSLLGILGCSFNILAAIGGFAKYLNKNNFFSKFSFSFVVTELVIIAVSLIISLVNQNIEAVFFTLYSSIFAIAYISSYLIDKYSK